MCCQQRRCQPRQSQDRHLAWKSEQELISLVHVAVQGSHLPGTALGQASNLSRSRVSDKYQSHIIQGGPEVCPTFYVHFFILLKTFLSILFYLKKTFFKFTTFHQTQQFFKRKESFKQIYLLSIMVNAQLHAFECAIWIHFSFSWDVFYITSRPKYSVLKFVNQCYIIHLLARPKFALWNAEILIELRLDSLLTFLWLQFLNLSFSFRLTTNPRMVLNYKRKTSRADEVRRYLAANRW